MSRAEQAASFCSALLGGPEGDERLEGLYVTLWTSGDKRTRWRPANQPGAVASLVAELDEHDGSQAVYMSTTLSAEIRDCAPQHAADGKPAQHGEGNCRYRPHSAHSAGLIGLWVEIDIAGPGHESEHLPADREQAQKIIDAMGLRPTLVVSSGGGLHCWWMLAEPWLVRDADDPDAERALMAKLERDWVVTAKHHAEVLGRWKVDSVFDLARLLRPAGTTNRKIAGNPRKVEIISHDPALVYNPDDFGQYLPADEVLDAYIGPRGADGVRINLTDEQREILKEVNLNAVWARVNSPEYRAVDYTPPWLADMLELAAEAEEMGDPKSSLVRTWQGDRPDLKGDQSSIDAALTRLLFDSEIVDTEGVIEALMCRRLRLADSSKADKLDPRRRIDYLTRTVAKFRVASEQAKKSRDEADDRIQRMANVKLDVPDPKPEPEPADVPTDKRGVITDPDAAEQAATEYMTSLVEHEPATEDERRQAADDHVRTEHTGEPVAPRPAPADEDTPKWFTEERSEFEKECMDQLTELLVAKPFRERGVMVWCLESRDDGEKQKARVVFRLPLDFGWPIPEARPSRYRPGRPMSTDWWRRDVFDNPGGFRKALERDLKIISADTAAKEWTDLLRQLPPLWRRDSSGSDLAAYAHEWLFQYLMLHHGTGQVNEVGTTGRPWVRQTNGWDPARPPIIYIDRREFLEHCRRQPGTVQGRDVNGVIDHLHLTVRRPRLTAPGMSRRPTFLEIESAQFDMNEWGSIIEVTRHSYEISEGKRGLRVAQGDIDDEGGVTLGEREAR